MKLVIQREEAWACTPGTLQIEGEHVADTLELPWKGNARVVSCIPAGKYGLTWAHSPKFSRGTLRLSGVDGRSGILIHPGNTVEDLRGCIALGKRLGPETLTESRDTVKRVEEIVRAALRRNEAVTLEIRDPKGEG